MYITILAAFIFAYYFVEIAKMPKKIKELMKLPYTKRIKPFDCVPCLATWTAAALYFSPTELSQFILIVFTAGFLSRYIK